MCHTVCAFMPLHVCNYRCFWLCGLWAWVYTCVYAYAGPDLSMLSVVYMRVSVCVCACACARIYMHLVMCARVYTLCVCRAGIKDNVNKLKLKVSQKGPLCNSVVTLSYCTLTVVRAGLNFCPLLRRHHNKS